MNFYTFFTCPFCPIVLARLQVLQKRMGFTERNWTQADVASHLGVSRQTVNSIENGKYGPSLPLAFDISRLFEQPIEAIFQPEPEPLGSRGGGKPK